MSPRPPNGAGDACDATANAARSQTFQACTGALSTTVRSSIGTWFSRTWLSRTQAASNARWSRGRIVRAAFAPMGGVELRRYRAAVDLAGAVERQRGDNVDKTGMRIGRPLVETIGLEILRRDRRKIGRAHV